MIHKILLLLLLFSCVVFAQSNHHNNQSGDTIQLNEAGDVVTSISGGQTRVYGMSGGDMDINQCLATHSVLFGLWQGTHLNVMCVADGLDADGKHHEAAMMRCSVGRFRKVYGDMDECIRVTEYRPPSPPEPPDEGASGAMTQMAGYIDNIQEVQEIQQMESGNFEGRLAKIEAGQRQAARKAQERRDYAQMTLERLENDPEK